MQFISRIISVSLLSLLSSFHSIMAQTSDVTLAQPNRLLLSIGISQFDDSLWHRLQYASKDAGDIHDAFTALPQPFSKATLLNTQSAEGIRLGDVRRAMRDFEKTNLNQEDTLIVYISSHGTVAYNEDGSLGRYIITSDTNRQELTKTALGYDELIDWFNGLRSRKKVLILAFCHSGVGKSALTPQMKRALSMLKSPFFEEPVQERSEGSIILTASGWREPALEDPVLKNDVYTHFLLKGLHKDLNQDGAVSITEAHQFAAQATYKHTMGRQRPSAILELLGSDPVLINGAINTPRSASIYSLLGRFSELLVSIDGQAEQSIEKGITVPEGKVRLTVKDPQSRKIIADRIVSLDAGKEYAIDSFLAPSLPHAFLVGPTQLFLLNDKVRQNYVVNDSSGYRISYRHEQAFGIWAAEAAASYYPSVRESFRLNGNQFEQSRRLATFDLLLGGVEKLRNISAGDGSTIYELRLLGGLTGLAIDRTVNSSAFVKPKEHVFSPGVKLAAGVDVTFPYYLLKLSIGSDIAVLQNIAQEGPAAMIGVGFHLGVGMFW